MADKTKVNWVVSYTHVQVKVYTNNYDKSLFQKKDAVRYFLNHVMPEMDDDFDPTRLVIYRSDQPAGAEPLTVPVPVDFYTNMLNRIEMYERQERERHNVEARMQQQAEELYSGFGVVGGQLGGIGANAGAAPTQGTLNPYRPAPGKPEQIFPEEVATRVLWADPPPTADAPAITEEEAIELEKETRNT